MKDVIAPHEYLAEEDPKLYKSVKTQRGPLSDSWIEEISHNPGQMSVMCAYKLCKVEFRYWGMQSKIERFIHDVGAYSLLEISTGNPRNYCVVRVEGEDVCSTNISSAAQLHRFQLHVLG